MTAQESQLVNIASLPRVPGYVIRPVSPVATLSLLDVEVFTTRTRIALAAVRMQDGGLVGTMRIDTPFTGRTLDHLRGRNVESADRSVERGEAIAERFGDETVYRTRYLYGQQLTWFGANAFVQVGGGDGALLRSFMTAVIEVETNHRFPRAVGDPLATQIGSLPLFDAWGGSDPCGVDLAHVGTRALAPVEGFDIAPLAPWAIAGGALIDYLSFGDISVEDVGVGVVSRGRHLVGTLFAVTGSRRSDMEGLVPSGHVERMAGQEVVRYRHHSEEILTWSPQSGFFMTFGEPGAASAFMAALIKARDSEKHRVLRRDCPPRVIHDVIELVVAFESETTDQQIDRVAERIQHLDLRPYRWDGDTFDYERKTVKVDLSEAVLPDDQTALRAQILRLPHVLAVEFNVPETFTL